MLDPHTKVVRAIQGVSPVQVAIDTNHVAVFLDQNALGAQSATGPAGTLSLVSAQGKILRLLTGTGLYATSASSAGYVELGLDPQNVQLRAPFSVRDAAGVALRARFDAKAQIFTAMEVGGGPPPAGSDLAVGGSIGATGNISTSAALMANSLVPHSGTTVTAPYDFAVEGTLTLAGQNVAAALAASEPKFTAVSPLKKVINFQTGQLELRVDSPYYCAGRVNANATVASSIGRVGYTVTRHPDHPAGVYQITFNIPAPDNNYVITLTQLGSGNIKLWDSAAYSGPPTAARFYVVTYNSSWSLTNWPFHFAVVT
jgi:hypothetical protein